MGVIYSQDGSGTTVRVTVPTPTSHTLQGPVITDSITGGFNEEHTNAKFPIGTRVQTSDGRIYYYALNSGTSLKCTQFLTGGDIDKAETDTNLTYTVPAGGKTVTMTAVAAVITDQFANGYLRVGTSTTVAGGAGQFRKIRSNTLQAAAGTTFTIYLYDALTVGLDTTSDVFVHESPFYKTTTGLSQTLILGVNARNRVNPSKYFWIQTWGPAAVPNGTAVVGANDAHRAQIIASAGISSQPMSKSGTTGAQFIATALYDSTNMAAQQYELMFLNCMA